MPHPFYGSKEWVKLRSKVRFKWLARQRPCAWCNEPVEKGQRLICDHALPRNTHPQLALVESNIVLMHHACHNKKTAWVDENKTPEVGIDGFPVGGEWG